MKMAENRIMKCKKCNTVVESLYCGDAKCGECGDAEPVPEKTSDEGQEKHVPVVEKTDSGIKVRVGSVPHPMEESHFITFIEVIDGDMVYRKSLKPGQEPEAEFPVKSDSIEVREYCNVHGLWKA
jgi:superoxide reductase